MKLTVAVLAVLLASPSQDEPQYTRKFEKKDLVATALDGGPKSAGATVISSAEQWASFLGQCSPDVQTRLKKTKVDFGNEVLLTFALGPYRPSLDAWELSGTGFRGVIETADRVLVHFRLVRSDAIRMEDSFPLFVARLPKTQKKIEFKKATVHSGG